MGCLEKLKILESNLVFCGRNSVHSLLILCITPVHTSALMSRSNVSLECIWIFYSLHMKRQQPFAIFKLDMPFIIVDMSCSYARALIRYAHLAVF